MRRCGIPGRVWLRAAMPASFAHIGRDLRITSMRHYVRYRTFDVRDGTALSRYFKKIEKQADS
jgi:hypothetical protein